MIVNHAGSTRDNACCAFRLVNLFVEAWSASEKMVYVRHFLNGRSPKEGRLLVFLVVLRKESCQRTSKLQVTKASSPQLEETATITWLAKE